MFPNGDIVFGCRRAMRETTTKKKHSVEPDEKKNREGVPMFFPLPEK